MNRLTLIDDDPAFGTFIEAVAREAGYEVRLATSAKPFKEHVTAWNPTVIMMDLCMPGEDGMELLRWLAAAKCKTPMILTSSFDARVIESARRIGLERGLDIRFTLTKPAHLQEVRVRLAQLRQGVGPVDQGEIERAFTGEEVSLQYHPNIVLKKGNLHSVTADVCWHHPRHGTLSSESFIPAARRAGLAGKLDTFALLTAVRQQKAWRQQGLDIQVVVALAETKLDQGPLEELVTRLCQESAVPLKQMALDISSLNSNGAMLESLDALTRLRLKGCGLVMDGFSSGFSSLAQIQKLPVTDIKIGSTQVAEAAKSREGGMVIRALIEFAHGMQLTTLAEGIDQAEHYQLLTGLGCDLGQGRGIAPPMAADALGPWYAKWSKELNKIRPCGP